MTTLHEPVLTTTPADLSVWPASTTEPRPGDLAVGGVPLAEVATHAGRPPGQSHGRADMAQRTLLPTVPPAVMRYRWRMAWHAVS